MRSITPLPFSFSYPDPPEGPTTGQCDCDGGDCACSLPVISIDSIIPRNNMSNDVFLKRSPGSTTMSLRENYSICYGPFHEPTIVNVSANEILKFFESPRSTKQLPSLWEQDWGSDVILSSLTSMESSRLLLEKSVHPNLVNSPQVLSAWLHVTDRCNLRCEYCYLPHVKKDMTLEVGRGSVDSVFRSALANNYKQVKLKYAGGEALLRFAFIEEMHKYAQMLSVEFGIQLNEVILSNATLLTPSIAKAIKSMGIRLMVSIDGIGHYHDAQRSYANGKGSFLDTQRGAMIALEEGIATDVSITISSKNIQGLPEVLEWVLDKDFPFSLNFYRENDLVVDPKNLRFEEDKIIEGMRDAYKVIERNLPRRSLLSSLVDRANLSSPHLKTCGVGDNYMVFSYNGEISKCQMQMNKPVTTFISADPLLDVRTDKNGILNMLVDEKEGCRTCDWKYWCAGGCSLTTFRATGRYDIKSPNCNIYKALYPEAVRLEGLRLLKIAEEINLIQ